ncbi:Syntabulin [Anabarilius grahami]|uniref:Syntabulin n=1 Tax=Anabarilius grahami TaxID=495550 RepID=A0A3N0XS57_ANAGA|nr:Syntabulin [Anabarilius grahami]
MRSRIPRFVLHPLRTKVKESSVSNMPLSEEESKDFDISSQHSKRTISPNSLSSDDTGCPSSQCASPTKTPSVSDNSPLGSPSLGERKVKVKRVRMNVVAEWSAPTQKHKREKQQRASIMQKGSETDFSSSSSTGSYKTHETLPSNSAGKISSSRSRGPYIRSLPVFKPAGSPTAPRDAELYAPYRTPPKAPSVTNSSSNSSSTRRRTTPVRYHSCGDNHGIKPPNPEQYLTPLQQKEVVIRHLKTKLRDSQNTVCDRESEIEELKSQLGRMREDWIEEECHRVEAQLALKEARKEIKQLRQVVETMKNSLMEKDKGIQKYFIDINIQNRKLESLLHSMELAQNGCNLQDETTLDFCESPERSTEGKLEMDLHGEEQAVEEMADSELLANDEMANRAEILEQVLMSTAVDSSQDGGTKIIPQPGLSTLELSVSEKSTEEHISSDPFGAEDKGVQTDDMVYTADLQALLFQLLKLQGGGFSGLLITSPHQSQELPSAQVPKKFEDLPEAQKPIKKENLPEAQDEVKDVGLICSNTAQNAPSDSGLCISKSEMSPQFMEELNFDLKNSKNTSRMAVVEKSHWSNNFLVDLVAVAAPVLPTVAWLYSQHGLVGGAPVYNIAALIRGCCIMGLHSLRHVSHGPDT